MIIPWLPNNISCCRAEHESAANGRGCIVNELLSAYHTDDQEDKELTPAVQELCAAIDAYIFVIDRSKAVVEGQFDISYKSLIKWSSTTV